MLKVDYHIHSSFSDGEADFKQIIDKAKEMGLYEIAITDHFDKYDENLKNRSLTDNELIEHFKLIKDYGENIGLKVLCGIETCTDFKGNIRLSDRIIDNCDIIITSPHYIEYDGNLEAGNYYDIRYWECFKQKVLNIATGQGDILGHCEAYLPFNKMLIAGTTTYEERQAIAREIVSQYFDDIYIDELIKSLKKSGKALELHCVTSTPRETVIKRMVENGIRMSLGSDAHILSSVGAVEWGLKMLEKYGGQSLLYLK